MPTPLPSPYPSALPAPLPPPPVEDHSAEGDFILLYNQAIAMAALFNTNALAVYEKQCEFWLANAIRAQNNKQALPDKPLAPLGYVVRMNAVAATVLSPSQVQPQAVPGTAPLAPPCPDPSPETPAFIPPPNDPVGEFFGGDGQAWYRVAPGAVNPLGSVWTDPRGAFVRRQQGTPTGFVQYWLKVA